jgi:hypothetical protein
MAGTTVAIAVVIAPLAMTREDMRPEMKSSARPLDAFAVSLTIALCLSWGFNQVAVKLALPDIPPLIQAATRSAGAGPSSC